MRAVDTNVVVRMITADDQKQLAALEARLSEGFFVSHGVLMEVEWVLRSAYRYKRDEINHALLTLILLDEIRVPNAPFVLWALDRHGDGADFADMLHVVAARGTSSFLTFDKDLDVVDAPLPIEVLK